MSVVRLVVVVVALLMVVMVVQVDDERGLFAAPVIVDEGVYKCCVCVRCMQLPATGNHNSTGLHCSCGVSTPPALAGAPAA